MKRTTLKLAETKNLIHVYQKVFVGDGLAGVVCELEGAADHRLADLLLPLLLKHRVLLRL